MQIIRVKLINSDGRTKGCENAPISILNELKKINSNGKNNLVNFENLNLEEIHVDLKNMAEAEYLIFENSKEAFERNFKTFFIGGDHSIDYSIVRAFNKTEKKPLLIVFDAHADLYGQPFNRRWLKEVIKEEFNPGGIVLISPRNITFEEQAYIKKAGIILIRNEVLQENIEDVCNLLMERARNASGFYISIDMDVLDPAFAPGAVDLEAGGLSSRELLYLVRRLSLLQNFKGADIVEINPDKDINDMTVKLGARLIAEMM